ncbi:MAG: NfeD family protein [Thermoplasmata archaeon]|nr:NfeD family protein [Thermoplasmata archaeon]
MELGIILIVFGIFMLISEVLAPGFFIAIPGTVMLALGLLGLVYPPALESWWTPLLVVGVGIPTFILTIEFYKKFGPVAPPITTSATSLKGKKGKVTVDIDMDSLKGKVKINNQIWSATSDHPISAGTEVEVVKSEGVHVTVRPVHQEGQRPPSKKVEAA